ncbi:YhdP family protein [Cognatilysobacter tabacisoli]|uniref:YhdP family protein n=1 Tax=Cognatilysobacter tabacisoli TaxID=2315424 RepID=UPI000E6B3C7D|nr:YhdP family protein [Lysobacter tabacisoli]
MPTPLRRRLRLARRGAGYTVAIALVLVALLLGVASQVLPLAERNPERIAAWLSERAGRPVAFDRVETEWTRRGPLLKLDRLRVGEGAQAFTVGDTEMLVSVYGGVLPGRPFSELRLRGLDLTLLREDDGRWRVRGLPGQEQPGGDPFAALERLGELQVIGARLAVDAPSLGIDARVPRIDVRLRVDGNRIRAGVRAWPREGAAPVDGALDFDRTRGDGRAYAGALKGDLAPWAPVLHAFGVHVDGGRGRAQAWAELRDHRVAGVTVDAALSDVALRGRPLVSTAPPPRQRFAKVQALARWHVTADGWRVDAPTLRVGTRAREQRLDGLVIAGGAQQALLAERIDAAPLLATLALSDRLAPALRRWLLLARPQGALEDVAVAGRRGGTLQADARIVALGFQPVNRAPGLSGLSGVLSGDADGFHLRLDPDAPVRFDWPRGFGTAHTVRLRGDVAGWRDGAGWRIETPGLHIGGNDYGGHARGGLRWQGDGTRPWIDLAVAVDDSAVVAAKGFWMRELMPPAAVRWLDMALVGGRVQDGRAIVSGDLDDWPFVEAGRFDATARIADATLKYHEGWPAADDVALDAHFFADGFTVEGTGTIAGIGIRRMRGGIDHYRGGHLTVDAEGTTDARQLLALLRNSPLQQMHGETLSNLSVAGPARADFRLDMPLRDARAFTLGGAVDLTRATASDARWKLAFDQVTGRAEYSRSGLRARDLSVRHDGQPGRLSLRAGDEYVLDRAHVFEAGLDASLTAAQLVERAPDLGWLRPYLDGRSNWTVGVTIPKSVAGRTPPARLQLRSSLVGTALTLPAPLDKPAGAALAASIDTPLPLGSGDVRVTLGERMALRARTSSGAGGASRTGVRIALGSDRVDEAPPVSGLVATGRADALDAIDWIALARGGGDGGGVPLQRIDVTARRLLLFGGAFPDTRVEVVPAARGATAVRTEGEALEGAVLLSAGEAATVAGRFERVHWQPLPRAPGQAVAAIANAGDDTDPARIPPLSFDIDDLRIGAARLGSARVRTRPTANGLRIEQVQTRTPAQRIDVEGDWTGRGAAARTRLLARVDSDNFGALLDGFGMGGRVAGGKGNLTFDAGWAGSPQAFRLAALDGRVTLDARDGRLVEIEPGAGRVLGLLSVAELPRRLTLDFRDFFAKGFAFNRMGGSVRVADGLARSEDLVIDGASATIDIRGSANLRTESFDQTIEVKPKPGGLLTVAGALAGGPVGAAIGAAANAVLQKPLGQMTSKTYRVTGPWKEPKVEVISREQGRLSAAGDDVPAG